MFAKALKSLFGSRNDRLLKQYRAVVEVINGLEPAMQQLSDVELAAPPPAPKEKGAAGPSLD